MPWVRVDDCFADHPKVVAAGPMASWLYVCGLTYSARLLTDGFIPVGQVRKLADLDGAMELAEKLVTVGLWKRVENGFQINDYLEYNPSAEKVRADRKAAQERMQRLRSGEVRANNERTSPEVRDPHPTPTPPRPTPTDIQDNVGAHAPNARAKCSAYFETFWSEYPKGHGNKQQTYAAWKRHGLDRKDWTVARDEVMHGLYLWKQSARWKRGFIKAAEIWIRDRWWDDEPSEDEPARASPNGPARVTADDYFAYAEELGRAER